MSKIPALNPHVYPDGGFKFRDADGVTFQEGSLGDLVEAVRAFRVRHGKPMGDVGAEVMAQICARSPQSCRVDQDPTATRVAIASVRFGSRVVRWIGLVVDAMSTKPIPLVGKAEAERRAQICKECPRQAVWRTGCLGCDGTANRLALSVRMNKETASSGKLLACEVLSEDTRTSIWLAQKPAASKDLPENCWRRP